LSRLAAHYSVAFVEEPVFDQGEAHWDVQDPLPGLRVFTPHTPIRMGGFHDAQLPSLRALLRELAPDYGRGVVWLYTPMALPLLEALTPQAVAYDCMDELTGFRFAPRQLAQRESALMKVAHVVFTGGPSLYRAKRDRHPNVHCLPSSVDARHFELALDPANEHPRLVDLPRPRLGYFGVLDERMDLDLVAFLARERPQWQFIFVGPVAKIDAETLPRSPNLHYFGQQDYALLPSFLAAWDVALMPFALNEATRYISPTKVLEYMAGGRPIVSTPIVDVAGPYGEVVDIAGDGSAFLAACERALRRPAGQQAALMERMREIVARTSWDATAARVLELLAAASRERSPEPAPLLRGAAAQADAGTTLRNAAAPAWRTIVIGAGPTGLSTAYHLDADTLVLDRNETVGGWCRSVERAGYTFDYAGHIMFSKDPYVHELYRVLLGDNVHWQDREAWVYSKGVHTRYPFQGALYGLPPKVLKECLLGAIEARFGHLHNTMEPANSALDEDCCADGSVALPCASLMEAAGAYRDNKPRNFEEFIYRVWGRGVAEHFAIPYNRKLWAVPLTEMETSWLEGRVPLPDLAEMISGALEPVAKPMGPNARFGYPLRGGFQALVNGFLPHLKGRLELCANVVQVSPSRRTVQLDDGRRFTWGHLVSTMPLPQLVAAMGEEAPPEIRAAAKSLRHVSVRCVHLGIAREKITDRHWIYYPEDTIFHRIFAQGNASPHCNAPGGFGLTCEISYSAVKPLPCEGEALIARCIEDCVSVGMIRAGDRIEVALQVDLPCAYVVYDHQRPASVERIRAWLAGRGIVLAGRYSEWEYYNSDHAFLAGRKAAQTVSAAAPAQGPAMLERERA
jgi:protoporphyrinogen oxidase/glycosyltransferase involved in cell wall biosynthesis